MAAPRQQELRGHGEPRCYALWLAGLSGGRDEPVGGGGLGSLAAPREETAARLVAGLESNTPQQRHGLAACRASLAEAAGDYATAVTAYADAPARWREFGDVSELAYALLGHGRCLVALGAVGADGPLRDAREQFTTMGYARPSARRTRSSGAGGGGKLVRTAGNELGCEL